MMLMRCIASIAGRSFDFRSFSLFRHHHLEAIRRRMHPLPSDAYSANVALPMPASKRRLVGLEPLNRCFCFHVTNVS